jgi:hypothetical protein
MMKVGKQLNADRKCPKCTTYGLGLYSKNWRLGIDRCSFKCRFCGAEFEAIEVKKE